MTTNPVHYLELAASRHADLIMETEWDRLLRPTGSTAPDRLLPLRGFVASQLRRLANWLYVEPDALATSSSA